MKYFYNRGDSPWQQKAGRLAPREIRELYERGLAGCWYDGEAHDRFRELAQRTGGHANFGDAATAAGFAGNFAGQLVLPFIWAAELFPGCWPGPAQERGDCVSHGLRTGCFGTVVGDIVGGLPDEETGLVEGPPEISRAGTENLVLSSEWNWWWRGYNGDGWEIFSASESAIKHGVMLRQPYGDLGFDLTQYSYANTTLYGRNPPPEKAAAVGRQHRIATAADANSFEELRDAFGNGHGVTSDGGEGFSSRRDQYGYSPRSGSWAHDFPQIGADDRDIIKQVFGEPLVLCLNNWGVWNSGPRDIYQSAGLVPAEKKARWIELDLVNPATGNILIPPGAWWTKWSNLKNRDFKVFGGARGWAKKSLPTLGAEEVV